MEMLARPEQPEKANSPISVTDGGDDGVLAPRYKRITLRMYYGIAILSRVVDLVVLGNNDAREAGTIREYPVINLRYRWGDRDVREAGATRESIMPNLRYRWRDGDVRKAGALREGIIPNLCHRWGGWRCSQGWSTPRRHKLQSLSPMGG